MPKKMHIRLYTFLLPLFLLATVLFLSAAVILLPHSSKIASAASGGGALPDTADYTFTVTYDGGSFSAAEKDGKLSIAQTGSLPEIIKNIDSAVAAQEPDAVKWIAFDIADETDIGTESIKLGEGTYIIENLKITGTRGYSVTEGLIAVTEAADAFITGGGTSITNTDSAGENSVALSRTGTGSLAFLAGRISAVKYGIYHSGAGTVYVSGGEVISTGNTGYAVYNDRAGTVHISGGVKISAAGTGVCNFNQTGTVNISGGAEIAAKEESGRAVYVNNGAVNISGGVKISSNGTAAHLAGAGAINISGGDVSSGGTYAILITAAGKLNISGGRISSAKDKGYVIRNSAGGTVNISGGEITAAGEDSYGIYNATGAVNISGGEITVDGEDSYGIYNAAGIVNIPGGQISAENRNCFGVYNNAGGTVNVLGGLISVTGAGGCGLYNNGAGTIDISYGAVTAGGTAVHNNAGGTVSISGGELNSLATFAAYNYGSGTLNISGGRLSSPIQTVCNYGNGTVNISGGEINMTDESGSGYAIMNRGGGTVNISGGAVSAAGSGTAVYNNDTGLVNISGGTVTAVGGYAIVIARAGTVCITQAEGKTTYITAGSKGTAMGTIEIADANGRLEIFGGELKNTGGRPLIYNPGNAAVIIPEINNLHEENLTVNAAYDSENRITLAVDPTTTCPSSVTPAGVYRPDFPVFTAGFYTYQWYLGEIGSGELQAGATQPSISGFFLENVSYYVMVGTKPLTDYLGLPAKTDVISGQFTVTINHKPSISASWVSEIHDAVYDGREHRPNFTIKDGEKTLVENVDYTVWFINNFYPGTASVTIKGMGLYSDGMTEITFTIIKADGSGSVYLEDWKEGSEAKTPAVRSITNPAGGAVFEYKARNAPDSEYTDEVPVKAGEYTVRARVAEGDWYNGFITEGFNFTIEKSGLSVGAIIGIAAGFVAAAALAGFVVFRFVRKRKFANASGRTNNKA